MNYDVRETIFNLGYYFWVFALWEFSKASFMVKMHDAENKQSLSNFKRRSKNTFLCIFTIIY